MFFSKKSYLSIKSIENYSHVLNHKSIITLGILCSYDRVVINFLLSVKSRVNPNKKLNSSEISITLLIKHGINQSFDSSVKIEIKIYKIYLILIYVFLSLLTKLKSR